MRGSTKLLLIYLGMPVCFLLTSSLATVVERGLQSLASRGHFIDPSFSGLALAVAFVVFYSVWVWLVLRRWKPKETDRAFEVLPPKE